MGDEGVAGQGTGPNSLVSNAYPKRRSAVDWMQTLRSLTLNCIMFWIGYRGEKQSASFVQ